MISPSQIRANYCKGECDLGVMAPESRYTDLIQKTDKDYSPCCTPRKMSGINIMYRKSNTNIIEEYLDNMTVEECGCGYRDQS